MIFSVAASYSFSARANMLSIDSREMQPLTFQWCRVIGSSGNHRSDLQCSRISSVSSGSCLISAGIFSKLFRVNVNFLNDSKEPKLLGISNKPQLISKFNYGRQSNLFVHNFFFYSRKSHSPKNALCRPRWASKTSAIPGFYKRCTSWLELETCYADLKSFAISSPLPRNANDLGFSGNSFSLQQPLTLSVSRDSRPWMLFGRLASLLQRPRSCSMRHLNSLMLFGRLASF
jgi:hypothetical protein